MFSNKHRVVICDMTSITDPETLDKTRTVDNAKKIVCEKDLVGVQTQQLGQSQNMLFKYSLTVDRMFYNNQKYVYLDGELYKVETVTPAKKPKDCKLIVSAFQDLDIKNAIESWLNNQNSNG